jgi:hypothetical protein
MTSGIIHQGSTTSTGRLRAGAIPGARGPAGRSPAVLGDLALDLAEQRIGGIATPLVLLGRHIEGTSGHSGVAGASR